jgi:hypothetical protein
MDESIVSVDPRDGLYWAKSPGVTYVFTLQMTPAGLPYMSAERVTVVP